MKDKENFEMVVSLRRLVNTRHRGRAVRAVKLVKEIVARHTGAKRVVISGALNEILTGKGRDKAPGKVMVVVSRLAEGVYLVKPAIKLEVGS
jgi:ribosomal protein L31E